MGRPTGQPLSQMGEELRGENRVVTSANRTDAVAAGAASTQEIYRDARPTTAPAGGTADTGGTAYEISYTPDATITGAATNNFALSVHRYNGGADQGAVTNVVTFGAGTNQAALTPLAFTPVAAMTDATGGIGLNPGDSLVMVVTQNGTGMAVPAGNWSIRVASEVGA